MKLQVPICWMLALLAGGLLGGCDAAESEAEEPPTIEVRETTLDGLFLEAAVEGALQGTEVHLNNYGVRGEERSDSWQRSDDAFIRLGPVLGGSELRFTLDESRTDAGPFRLLYYVQDVNVLADSIAVTLAEDSTAVLLDVVMPLEERDAEFKGHCLSTLFGGVRGCFGGSDSSAPDVQLDDGALVLTLQPLAFDGSLTFEVVAVRLEGEVQAGGICNLGLGGASFDVCNALGGYRDNIRRTFETLALDELNQETVRIQIAAGMRPLLDALGIGEVLSIRRNDEGLTIIHQSY